MTPNRAINSERGCWAISRLTEYIARPSQDGRSVVSINFPNSAIARFLNRRASSGKETLDKTTPLAAVCSGECRRQARQPLHLILEKKERERFRDSMSVCVFDCRSLVILWRSWQPLKCLSDRAMLLVTTALSEKKDRLLQWFSIYFHSICSKYGSNWWLRTSACKAPWE